MYFLSYRKPWKNPHRKKWCWGLDNSRGGPANLDTDGGEELVHVQPSGSIGLGNRAPESPGTLYITTKQVVWLSDVDRTNGYAVDFLSISLHAVSREPEGYSPPCIYARDILIAATDTSSTTVEWVMTEMLRHPTKMRRAREEIEEVVGNQNIVEESHLPKLLYLDAIIKETLRLHPTVPFLVPRNPSRDCCVAGYTIPRGSRVIINLWKIQRDPEVWENPEEFEPERFLKEPEKGDYHGNFFSFLPFGSGRRICAGLPLAEKMMKYVLATLLHSFEWEIPAEVELDVSEKFGVVMKKMNSLVAIPIPRLATLEQ